MAIKITTMHYRELREESGGICLECLEVSLGVGDARQPCPLCGSKKFFGAEELLMRGALKIIDQDDFTVVKVYNAKQEGKFKIGKSGKVRTEFQRGMSWDDVMKFEQELRRPNSVDEKAAQLRSEWDKLPKKEVED